MSRLLLIFLASFLAASAAPVERLPVSTFFKKPAISQLLFSPDSKRIAYLAPYERRLNLVVLDLEKGTKNLVTNFTDKEISGILWASNDRLLFQIDIDGEEAPGLYAVNRDGSDPVVLASGGRRASGTTFNDRFGGLLRRLPKDPKHMLVLAFNTSRDRPDVARINLKSGAMETIVPTREGISEWILDRNNETRIGIYDEGGKRKVFHRAAGSKGDWEQIFSGESDGPNWEPIGFDGDNRTLYVASNVGRERYALYRYDTTTKQFTGLVAEDPVYDVGTSGAQDLTRLLFSDSLNKYVGVSYQADRMKTIYWEPEYAKRQELIDHSLPDTINRLIQSSEDGKRHVYFASNDRDPGVYYLLNTEKKKLEELAVVIPGVDPEKMAPMKPVTFKARDGVTLHGYLTLPVGVEPKDLPLIVNPHGGPYGIRDTWGFNPEVQLLANRGFAVIQVNYRGSGGYGPEFERIGWKKWGLEMQDDLSDAVKWLTSDGVADPQRVVICGASYGGYATMAGLTFTPELYAAGINYVGVVDIPELIPKGEDVTKDRAYFYNTKIADWTVAEDRKRVHDTSPVNFADRIRVPLLMAYGKNDPRVRIIQGYEIESALKKAGNRDYKLIMEKAEGHGFRKEERSIAFYTEVDAFLDRTIPRRGTVVIKPTEVIDLPAKK